jgi:hypothetical protein
LSETFLILRRIKRAITTHVRKYCCKVAVILCLILINLEFPRQMYEKYSDTKFNEYPSTGNRFVPSGSRQTDRQTQRERDEQEDCQI